MLLRNRGPQIETGPVVAAAGYEHVAAGAIAVMRWLGAAGVDFVLVGAVARQARGETGAEGPVAIVPAPYGRNLDRLARALNGERAHERQQHESPGSGPARTQVRSQERTQARAPGPLRMRAELLVRPQRWELRFGDHDLDIEGRPDGGPSYQALLYEAVRFRLYAESPVEVAAPEDIEYYDHLRRTGVAPQMSVSRL